jgi:hypothetical protein
MEITHRIRIDMLRKGVPPVVDAMQFDAFTRVVEVELFSNGAAWNPPAGITFALSYGKPDGKRGFYEVLPDGNSAISVSGNVVSVTLAPQALTVAGTVLAALVMRIPETDRLSSFPFEIHVMADPSAGSTDSEDYFDPSFVGGNFLPMPTGAAVGQFFRVKEVDENGKVTAVEAVDLNAKTPTAYLYNGIQLPPLPDWDKSKYPYAVIYDNTKYGTWYGLYLCSMRPHQAASEVYFRLADDNNPCLLRKCESPFSEWGEAELIEKGVTTSKDTIVWTDTDFIYDNGEIFFAASEPPKPVYPENGNGSAEAVDAVLYTPQTLTPEQQEQARKNIGVEVSVPVMLNLTDYGIDAESLLLTGGGAAIYEDVGAFWEDVKAVKPGQSLLLTSRFGEYLIVPPPSTLYFDITGSDTTVFNILTTMTIYYDNKLLVATNILRPHGTSGAVVSLAVTGMVDVPAPEATV